LEARESARVRAELEKKGAAIGPLDTLIAGIAMAHGATLVTRNVDEFGRIDGMKVENWY
jgi:tRNA(fMet)-specific endonuclease VapC